VLIILLAFCATLPLIFILYHLFKNGISSINWEFLIHLPKPVGESGGGISNAIIGTAILIIMACIFSVPLGVTAGIYLSENQKKILSYGLTLSAEILQGIPSIVIGIIAYVWIVSPIGTFSALSGGAALAIMMLPVIIKTTEETLILIPYSLKEASLALGVPYYRTIIKVILPAGLSGIATGILLAIARVAGETAPLLFTAFGNPFMNFNILKPVNAMPLLIFNYARSPYPAWLSLAWGASLVLIIFILLLNLSARLVTRRWKIKF
jgi:phosphate transport system permease protein